MATESAKDKWSAPNWFGSISTLLDAARIAEAELREIDGDSIERQEIESETNWEGGRAAVSWPGGTFSGTLDELEDAQTKIEARENLESVTLTVATPSYTAVVSASAILRGIDVRVEGPRPTIVHGLVSTLKRKLEAGVDRVRHPPPKRPSPFNWAALLIPLGGSCGLIYFITRGVIEYGFDLGWALLYLLSLFLPLFGLAGFFDRGIQPGPKTLELVPEADEDKPPPEPDTRGPVLRARDWLKDHPILGLAGGLVLAVVGDLISRAI
jgi:hypothetical protein